MGNCADSWGLVIQKCITRYIKHELCHKKLFVQGQKRTDRHNTAQRHPLNFILDRDMPVGFLWIVREKQPGNNRESESHSGKSRVMYLTSKADTGKSHDRGSTAKTNFWAGDFYGSVTSLSKLLSASAWRALLWVPAPSSALAGKWWLWG